MPHRGVSAARNAGLDIAGGRFIAFADSDDMPESTWLEELRKPFKDGKRGLSICGYTVVDRKGRKLYGTEYREETRRSVVLTPQKMLEDLFSNRLYYQGYVWNKMFERSILEAEPVLRFDESIYYNEDRLFAFHYLLRCPAIYYSGISHYKYRASRERERYHPKYLTEMKAFEIMLKEVKGRKWERAGFYLEKDMLRAAAELYELIGEANNQQDRKYLEKVLWKERETIYHE